MTVDHIITSPIIGSTLQDKNPYFGSNHALLQHMFIYFSPMQIFH
jgi:hypothetical protein